MENTTKAVHPLHPSNLANFHGSETFTRHWLGKIVMTEGMHYVANNGAAWLLDIVASVQSTNFDRDNDGFQNWTLKSNGSGGFIVTCDDGNGNITYTQKGEYTDFPFGNFEGGVFSFYVELGSLDGVKPCQICMLKSER